MTGAERPSTTLRRLVNGYQVSQAIHVAASLGIADLLAAGPRASEELAADTGTHPGALYRLLRALAAVGVLEEDGERRFVLTPLGEPLRSDVADSIAGWAAFVGRPYYWQAWSALGESVRSGENAFRQVHGVGVWEYRSTRPEEALVFDRAMASVSGRVGRALVAAYDFGRFGTVADVGGGHGGFLAALLTANPAMRGVLFDLPHVVATAGPTLQAAGVAERCRIEAGSFFDAVPAGSDAYVLMHVIHDWEDAEAVEILRTCARAAAGSAPVLLVEQLVAPPNAGPETKLSDLNMLVGPGGLERTREEFAQILAAAGLRLERVAAEAFGQHVLEAVAA